MSGAMRRIGEYLGLLEDTGRYDEYGDAYDEYDGRDPRHESRQESRHDRYDDEHPTEQHAPRTAKLPRREAVREYDERPAAPVADLTERRRVTAVAPVAPAVAELSRIITLHPRTYNEARTVGEHFRDGTPVIMNLTEMSDDDAKRLVDFAAGLVFATRGTIERITAKVFLLSPPNVSVAAEDKQRIAEGGFFNQS